MRRVSARCLKPGMVVGKAICDSYGNVLFDAGAKLPPDGPQKLSIHGVLEVLVEDWRVADVPVEPSFPAELEAEAAQALRQLLTESRGCTAIDEMLLSQLETPLHRMIRTLFPEVMGEVNVAGCTSVDEFRYVRPVKVAEISLLMGKRAGYKMTELAGLGLAALLMDVGFVLLAQNTEPAGNALGQMESAVVMKHPDLGAGILGKHKRLGADTVQAVLQHHERWDGSGYPRGLKGSDICRSARIIAIADTYYELVSDRPGRRGMLPHSAIEFIMASSGDLFDSAMVQIFSRQVPLYPTGVAVKLNTGEVGIISDGNTGHIGRPIVRICHDAALKPLARPFDIDLSESEYQDRLIVQMVD